MPTFLDCMIFSEDGVPGAFSVMQRIRALWIMGNGYMGHGREDIGIWVSWYRKRGEDQAASLRLFPFFLRKKFQIFILSSLVPSALFVCLCSPLSRSHFPTQNLQRGQSAHGHASHIPNRIQPSG